MVSITREHDGRRSKDDHDLPTLALLLLDARKGHEWLRTALVGDRQRKDLKEIISIRSGPIAMAMPVQSRDEMEATTTGVSASSMSDIDTGVIQRNLEYRVTPNQRLASLELFSERRVKAVASTLAMARVCRSRMGSRERTRVRLVLHQLLQGI